ncbi:membrane hypothetical protein [Candidatus Magnetomoraceae bacterium gMMP-13]
MQGIVSAMIMPVVQAYVGEITPIGREGAVMGIFHISIFSSMSIGPILGGLVKDNFGLQASFACMGILAFISFLMAFFLLPPRKHEKHIAQKQISLAWTKLLKYKEVSGLFFFRAAYTTCIGIIWSFIPVLADAEFKLSSSLIGILVMLGVFINGIMQVPMGYVADKFNKRILILSGGLIIVYSMFYFQYAQNVWDLFGASVIFGIGGGISMPAIMAISVIKGNETKSMGSVMALLTMGHSLGMLLGAFFAGIIMDIFNLRLSFGFGGMIMMIGMTIFFICTTKKSLAPQLSTDG